MKLTPKIQIWVSTYTLRTYFVISFFIREIHFVFAERLYEKLLDVLQKSNGSVEVLSCELIMKENAPFTAKITKQKNNEFKVQMFKYSPPPAYEYRYP